MDFLPFGSPPPDWLLWPTVFWYYPLQGYSIFFQLNISFFSSIFLLSVQYLYFLFCLQCQWYFLIRANGGWTDAVGGGLWFFWSHRKGSSICREWTGRICVGLANQISPPCQNGFCEKSRNGFGWNTFGAVVLRIILRRLLLLEEIRKHLVCPQTNQSLFM